VTVGVPPLASQGPPLLVLHHDPLGFTASMAKYPVGDPCMFGWESCHPATYSAYERSHGDGPSVAIPREAVRWGKAHLQGKLLYLIIKMEISIGIGRVTCFLQYPVDSQKSSSVADFLVFPAFRHACALTMVSSIPTAPFSAQGPSVFCHSPHTSSQESPKLRSCTFWMSRCESAVDCRKYPYYNFKGKGAKGHTILPRKQDSFMAPLAVSWIYVYAANMKSCHASCGIRA